jgi:hypothetical protein
MRILPEMTISCRVRHHCAQYSQIQIQPRYDHLRMNRFQIQCLGCCIADVSDSTFHFLGGETPPVRGGWAGLCCPNKLKRHIGSDTTQIIALIAYSRLCKNDETGNLMELHPPDSSFADALLSGRENPPTPGADLRACILPPMCLCRSCTPIVSSLT